MKALWEYKIKRSKVMELNEASPEIFSGPMDIARKCKSMNMHNESQEVLHAFLLNVKNGYVGITTITRGLLDRSQIHAREVFRVAIMQNAAKVILVHNHPSGDPSPSSGDIYCSKEIKKAGNIIGIELADHIVIGDLDKSIRSYVSLKNEGLI